MGSFVTDKITTVDAKELVLALYGAWELFHGLAPSLESMACCLAQMALETGHMQACHCWNVGNIKRKGVQDVNDWTMFRCGEIVNGRLYMYDPPHHETHFRAYNNLDSGILDYIHFLAYRDRYMDAWIQVHLGDPEKMSRKLGKAGYYTADIDSYTEKIVKLYSQYLNITRLFIEPELLSDEDHKTIDGSIAISLDSIAREVLREQNV